MSDKKKKKLDRVSDSMTDPASNERAIPGSSDHTDQRRDEVNSGTNGSADEILRRRRGSG